MDIVQPNTGLLLVGKLGVILNNLNTTKCIGNRRASSTEFVQARPASDRLNEQPSLQRQPWALQAEAGAGLKARRLSVAIPADYAFEIVDLHTEYIYPNRLFRHGKVLGRGATSTVTLMARKGEAGELYAVKQFRGRNKSEPAEAYEMKVKSEFSIAKSLHHPNIVRTIQLCTDRGKWNHVMEYCREGDLFGFVKNGFLQADERASDRNCLFKQMIQGINYLHTQGIAHRDIKLENLLIDSQSRLKITDFGVSEVFRGVHPGLRAAKSECGTSLMEIRLCPPGICGSMPYIAPEVVSKKSQYDPRPLDVWSAAVVMLHILCGGALWLKAVPEEKHYLSLVKAWEDWERIYEDQGKICENNYPRAAVFDRYLQPPGLRRLLICMLHPNPKHRKTINNIMANRWFKQIECCQADGSEDEGTTNTNIVDASVKGCCGHKPVHHNHLPPKPKSSLKRLPGSGELE